MVTNAAYRPNSPLYTRIVTATAEQMANQFLDVTDGKQIFAALDELKDNGHVSIEGDLIKRVARVNWGDLMGHLRKQAGILKANKFQTALLLHWNLLEQRKAS